MDIVAIVSAFGVLGALGVVFGALLTLASKMFYVEVDERVANVRAALSGANCGACGYAGCDAFAEAIVEGKAPLNGCTAGGASVAKAVAAVMGADSVEVKEQPVARVLCLGQKGVAKERYTYDGYQSCSMAASLSIGPKQCAVACLGLGDCERSCRFDAIKMEDGIAVIDPEKCVGCEACVAACPRHVIEMKSPSATVIVRCRNTDAAKAAKAACDKACIACKRCVKACEYDAITVENNCARIDDEKCTKCGACAKVCPTKCIDDMLAMPAPIAAAAAGE